MLDNDGNAFNHHTEISAIASAIQRVDETFAFKIELVRLVDGLSTYTLTYADLPEVLSFETHGKASEHVDARRNRLRAQAVIGRQASIVTACADLAAGLARGYSTIDDAEMSAHDATIAASVAAYIAAEIRDLLPAFGLSAPSREGRVATVL